MNITLPRPSIERWPLCLGLVALAILGAVAAGLWADRGMPRSAPSLPGPSEVTPREADAQLVEVDREHDAGRAPLTGLLADAFEAATGHRDSFDVEKDGKAVIGIWPEAILQLPFGKALLVGQQDLSGCHYCQGSFDIYYFRQVDGKIVITGESPSAVLGWAGGLPPENWRLTTRFTSYPAILASGDFMQHGIILRSSTLTELRPEGAVMSDVIQTGFDDRGFREDGHVCTANGRIVNVRKDIGFDVEVTGSLRTVERYRRQGNRFVRLSPIDWQQPCGK